jgi:hypothetical protein
MKWWLWLAAIVALGIFSRVWHTGSILWDKYLGDALYAAMMYAILSIAWRAPSWKRAAAAMAIMTALEVFQLTLIPAGMLRSASLAVRIVARLLGTEFSFRDLAAYVVGIGGVWILSSRLLRSGFAK